MKKIPAHKVYFFGAFLFSVLGAVLSPLFNNPGPLFVLFGGFAILYLCHGFYHLVKAKQKVDRYKKKGRQDGHRGNG